MLHFKLDILVCYCLNSTKLIAIITRLKEKRYFDGKNMYDDNYKDFKI